MNLKKSRCTFSRLCSPITCQWKCVSINTKPEILARPSFTKKLKLSRTMSLCGDSAQCDHSFPLQCDHLIPREADHRFPQQTDHQI